MPNGTYKLLKKLSSIEQTELFYEVDPPIEGNSLVGVLGLTCTWGLYSAIETKNGYRRQNNGIFPTGLEYYAKSLKELWQKLGYKKFIPGPPVSEYDEILL